MLNTNAAPTMLSAEAQPAQEPLDRARFRDVKLESLGYPPQTVTFYGCLRGALTFTEPRQRSEIPVTQVIDAGSLLSGLLAS
jgi:hypothetical protein